MVTKVLMDGNHSTDDGAHAYIASNYFPNATTAETNQLLELYPDDPAQGSPFDTGNANAVTPEFKRLAAVQGDLSFHGPRRFLLQHHTNKQPAWSYCKYSIALIDSHMLLMVFLCSNKEVEESSRPWICMQLPPSSPCCVLIYILQFHLTDLNIIYSAGDLTDYLINFVNHHDPNGRGNVTWPRYTAANPTLLTLLDGATPFTLEQDDFRVDAIKYMNELLLKYPS